MRGLTAACAAVIAGVLLFAAGARAQTQDDLPPDVVFARAIAVIRADLATGDELVKRRDWDAARRHVMFPLEEVYAIIREDLRTYKTRPFDGALRSLARAVKVRDAKQYAVAWQSVARALATADAGLDARQPNKPQFVMQVAIALLQTVPQEYEEAVANGRVVRPVSYQMARGFVLQAERMIDSVAPERAASNAAPLDKIRATIAQLEQAFGGVIAPKQAPLTVEEVADRVRRIAAEAASLQPS